MGFFLGILEVLTDDVEEEEGEEEEIVTEEDKAADEKLNKAVEKLGRKVAELRVEKKEIIKRICPLHVSSNKSVFDEIAELDSKTEKRRK